MNYFTSSELLLPETRELITTNNTLYFTGQPVHHFTEEKRFFFGECEAVFDLPLFVRGALVQCLATSRIPDGRPRAFREYLLINAEHQQTGDLYGFGVGIGYDFSMNVAPQPQNDVV